MSDIYDVIIIGAGPAGLTAALYSGRSMLRALVIEKAQDGGQISITDNIENYPGLPVEGESGADLTARMAAQARAFGAERVSDSVISVDLSGKIKKVICHKNEYRGKTVIIATGATPRLIGCPGEEDFTGRGVSYCATCDGPFFTGMDVYVVGGGDSAVEEALFLTRFARKVYIIHRRSELRAARSIARKAFNNPKIGFIWNSVVESLGGENLLSRMTLKNVGTGEKTVITADPSDGVFGLFVFIGMDPQTGLFADSLPLEKGYIKTDENMLTGIPGVFAAGDCRVKSLRQVVTAVSDGAIAAVQAEKYISETWQKSFLEGKKIILIGDTEGISAEEMETEVKACGGEVIFSVTECFLCSMTGTIENKTQQAIKDLCEKVNKEDVTVILGIVDEDSCGYTAETLVSGDSSGMGVLSGVALGLDIHHFCEPDILSALSENARAMAAGLDGEKLIPATEKNKKPQ